MNVVASRRHSFFNHSCTPTHLASLSRAHSATQHVSPTHIILGYSIAGIHPSHALPGRQGQIILEDVALHSP